jgi:hypothetical protein
MNDVSLLQSWLPSIAGFIWSALKLAAATTALFLRSTGWRIRQAGWQSDPHP